MQGMHTDEAPKQEPSQSAAPAHLTTTKTEPGTGEETFASTPVRAPLPAATAAPPPPPEPEEEDDHSVSVSAGTLCRRKGCGKAFVSDEVSRHGDGPEAKCVYHPKSVCYTSFS
jgi:hypothetical protein